MSPEVTIDWPGPPEFNSSDPNDIYRGWLEEHAGEQGKDWHWGLVENFQIGIYFQDPAVAILFRLTFATTSGASS